MSLGQQPEDGKDYAVMHVTGFIRGWPPAGYDEPQDNDMQTNNNNGSMSNYSLVAVARLQVCLGLLTVLICCYTSQNRKPLHSSDR